MINLKGIGNVFVHFHIQILSVVPINGFTLVTSIINHAYESVMHLGWYEIFDKVYSSVTGSTDVEIST